MQLLLNGGNEKKKISKLSFLLYPAVCLTVSVFHHFLHCIFAEWKSIRFSFFRSKNNSISFEVCLVFDAHAFFVIRCGSVDSFFLRYVYLTRVLLHKKCVHIMLFFSFASWCCSAALFKIFYYINNTPRVYD